MASIDSLSAQQRAVLQLLLRQGKSYDEIAALLHTDAAAIRRRAQGAVAALAPDDADVSPDRRNEIADYLLGQQTASQRAATREYLEGSAAGRAWARAASGALSPVGGAEKLPDVPAEREEVAEAFGALQARAARQDEVQRAAKRGSALLSAGLGLVLAIVIIVVVALVSSGGDDNAGAGQNAATTPAATSTTSTTGTGTTPAAAADDPNGNPQILAQGTLRPPEGSGSTASGQVAIVLFPNSRRYRLALTAKGIPPSSSSGSAYGVWFYTNKRTALFLGFPDKKVGANGRLDTVADLSPDTPNFREVLLTSERSNAPKTPGAVVLRAKLVIAQPGAAGGQATPTQTTP
jgi:Sigma-70, region 4